MPQYSRADILNQNNNDFPNNNSGQITPAILRDYNRNVADSVVFIGEPVSSSLSASYAATASLANTASYAINASAAATATTASYAITAQNAVTANTANTALYADNAGSASYADTASVAITSDSASFAQTSISSSYSNTSTSASYALTASFLQGTVTSASFATSASYALNSTSASFATNSANGFPFTGSARITGSLSVTGSTRINGNVGITGSLSTTLGVEVKSGDLDFSGGNINIYNGNINQFIGASTLQTTIISGSLTLVQGATGSLLGTASYATQALSASFAQNAVSASYAPGAVAFPYTGSADISGSLNLVGNAALYTGSIWLENNNTGSNRFYLKSVVTESYDSGIKNNIWFDRSYDSTFTGSQISPIEIIGHSNIINPSDLGFEASLFPKVGFTGIGNYVTSLPYYDASIDSIVTGSGIIASNNSFLVNSIGFRPKLSTTNLLITNVYQGRSTTINATGSVSLNNINNQSLLTINNIANNTLTLTGVYLTGTNNISTVSSSFNANIQNSFLTNVTAYISSSASGNGMFGVGAFGTGLIVSASGASSTTSGMGIVGTYNTADGVTDNVRQTRFLVGTGTSTGARRTSLHVSASGLTTISTGLTVSGSFNVANGITGSLLGTASYADTSTSASYAVNATSASYAVNATSASFASTIASGLNITASNILVTNDLTVNGTASFSYTKTTSGSAVIIGDEFIILNADSPFAPYAGIKVYDTGSASTASLEWNGLGDYWIQVEESGASAAILTGASGSKGSEVFPTLNRLTKGSGNNTILDSNITDSGTEVSINSNTSVTGSLNVSAGITGSLLGTASYSTNALSASFAQTASFYGGSVVSASYALNSTSASYAETATSASYAANSTSASYAVTASFLLGSVVSASYAATASSADAFNVRLSLTASGLRYPTADGLEGQVLKTDGTNDLAFGDVNTMYEIVYTGENITKSDPLYISGSQGANPIVYKADAANAAKMPVTYIASETITAGNTTRGIVLGLIEGIDLTGYPAGTEVYVAAGGGWTSTRPTGSAIVQILGIVTKEGAGGKGLILNPGPVELPNLQAGYTWVGDATGVPQAVSTSSLLVTSASYATNSTSASYSLSSTSASYSLSSTSASYALSSTSASYAETATSASYSLNSTSASFAQTAISASYAPSTPAFPFTGSADISGSLNLNGDQYITGSIRILPTSFGATNYMFNVTESLGSTNGVEGNLIISGKNATATQSGSVIVSGSTNIFIPSTGVTNSHVVGGGGAGFNGRSNIITLAQIAVTGSNGSGYDRQYPQLFNSVINSSITITDNRPTITGSAALAATSVAVNGTINATFSTGSISFSNSNVIGGLTINVTGSNGVAKIINNSLVGGATITIDSTSGANFQNNIVNGSGVALLLSGSTNGFFNSSLIVGNNLVVTGSSNTAAFLGAAYVGRYNDTGSTASPLNTVFAVGAGTAAATRKTALHVSSSGLVTLTDGLIVTGSVIATTFTGSLNGTASFATSASYALNSTSASYSLTSTSGSYALNSTSASYALTASYAENAGAGGVAAGDIYSYTFLLMGS